MSLCLRKHTVSSVLRPRDGGICEHMGFSMNEQCTQGSVKVLWGLHVLHQMMAQYPAAKREMANAGDTRVTPDELAQ